MAADRPIEGVELRPLRPDDKARLHRLFHRLSRDTIYRRFFGPAPPEPPEFMLDWLVTVDHTMREAVAAVQGDEVLAVARFDRDAEHPEVAEFAVVVEDAWQRRGLGRRLLTELLDVARRRGVTTLYGLTQPDNTPLLGLVRAVVGDMETHYREGLIEVRVAVPASTGG